jgi:hypothetical protein
MLLGGACGKAQGWGGHSVHHGAVRNNVPCTSRRTMSVFFARMEVVLWQQGGGCSNEGTKDGGATIAVEMLSSWRLQDQALGGAMRAGGGGHGCSDNGSGNVVVWGVGGG